MPDFSRVIGFLVFASALWLLIENFNKPKHP